MEKGGLGKQWVGLREQQVDGVTDSYEMVDKEREGTEHDPAEDDADEGLRVDRPFPCLATSCRGMKGKSEIEEIRDE